MLTNIHTIIIYLSCNYREHKKCVANIVYTYFFSIRQFLRIGTRADKVSAAFCIICLNCMEKLSITDDDDSDSELCKVESIANDELRRDIIWEIENENRLVKIYTYHIAMLYLKNIRPLIKVGNRNFTVK